MTKSLVKRLIAIISAAALVLVNCGLACSVAAETEETYKGYALKHGTTRISNISDSVDYCYSDGFFAESATAENEHMYTTSMVVAAKAVAATEPDGVKELLKDLGFNERTDNYAGVTPSENTIGVATGYKKITINSEDAYIVPVCIRGGSYGDEWIGNAVIGSSGNAENFQERADDAVSFVTANIIDKYKLPTDKVKIWIVGYSRGAAVANLAAKTFSDTYGIDDVYAYCMATPRCAVEVEDEDIEYTNIKNVIYDDDLVSYVAPSTRRVYGFDRYGKVKELSNSTANMPEYAAQLSLLNSAFDPDDNFEEYSVNVSLTLDGIAQIALGEADLTPQATGSGISQQEFLESMVSTIVTYVIPSRKYYSKTIADDGTVLDDGVTTVENTLKVIIDIIRNTDTSDMGSALMAALMNIDSDHYSYALEMLSAKRNSVALANRKKVYDDLWTGFVDAGGTANLSADQYNALYACRYTLMGRAFELIYVDAGDGQATIIGTLIQNYKRIAKDHEPIKMLAFLRSEDSYFMTASPESQKKESSKDSGNDNSSNDSGNSAQDATETAETAGTATTTKTDTGDSDDIALYSILGAIALCGAGCAYACRRRED